MKNPLMYIVCLECVCRGQHMVIFPDPWPLQVRHAEGHQGEEQQGEGEGRSAQPAQAVATPARPSPPGQFVPRAAASLPRPQVRRGVSPLLRARRRRVKRQPQRVRRLWAGDLGLELRVFKWLFRALPSLRVGWSRGRGCSSPPRSTERTPRGRGSPCRRSHLLR